jgi:hypothetical protein
MSFSRKTLLYGVVSWLVFVFVLYLELSCEIFIASCGYDYLTFPPCFSVIIMSRAYLG